MSNARSASSYAEEAASYRAKLQDVRAERDAYRSVLQAIERSIEMGFDPARILSGDSPVRQAINDSLKKFGTLPGPDLPPVAFALLDASIKERQNHSNEDPNPSIETAPGTIRRPAARP